VFHLLVSRCLPRPIGGRTRSRGIAGGSQQASRFRSPDTPADGWTRQVARPDQAARAGSKARVGKSLHATTSAAPSILFLASLAHIPSGQVAPEPAPKSRNTPRRSRARRRPTPPPAVLFLPRAAIELGSQIILFVPSSPLRHISCDACRPEPPAPISRQTTQIKPSASPQIAGARFISAGQGKLGALILQTLRENVNTDFNVESARGKGMRVTITFVQKPPLNRPN
jgi:hypothetical protein